MTDEIKKAMKCCANEGCMECDLEECKAKRIPKSVVALVTQLTEDNNRQKAEIERKTNHIAEITDEYANFKEAAKRREQAVAKNIERAADEEINRLKAEIKGFNQEEIKQQLRRQMYRSTVDEIKSEARKEFAESLEEKAVCIPENEEHLDLDVVFVEDVYNLLKEMNG